MYIPPRFCVEESSELLRFLNAHPFGAVVSATEQGLTATHIPFLIEQEGEEIELSLTPDEFALLRKNLPQNMGGTE